MKLQALLSSKNKSKKKIKCRLLQFLFGALRVNALALALSLQCHACVRHSITCQINWDNENDTSC